MNRLRIVEQITIGAPAESVWAVIADPETHTEWRPAVIELTLITPPPMRVGSQLREVVRFAGRQLELADTVTRLEPPHVLGIDGVSKATAFGLELRLEPVEGGTLTTFDWWLEPRSMLMRTAAPLLRRPLHKATAEELELLRAYVERRGGSGTNTLVSR